MFFAVTVKNYSSCKTGKGRKMKLTRFTAFLGFALCFFTQASMAGVIFGSDGNLGGGYRWDADYYEYNGLERSLDSGLRYSMQGGSLEAYRDLFAWDVVPTLEAFDTVVDQAFNAWTSTDPLTGLSTDIYFVDDTQSTQAVGFGLGSVDIRGAEIDLLVDRASDTGTRATSYFNVADHEVTLTSGTVDYSRGAIIGSDIVINNNPGAIYSIDFFGRLLTHEIGHSLGLGDLEDASYFGFIDDDFDESDIVATLNNSWALSVDPLDPSASAGLSQYTTLTNTHLTSAGVDLLMESRGLGIGPGNPVTNTVPLTNDDYGMRQFLYPTIYTAEIPEPPTFLLLIVAFALLMGKSGYLSTRP